MKKIAVLLAEGFEEIEAFAPIDLLRRARVYVDTVSITDDFIVQGAHGIHIRTEELFDNVDFSEYDMIILPGGMPGTTFLNEHPGVGEVVKEFAESGKYVAAICAAPTILSNLGLVEGRRIACYPGVEDQICGATINKAPVVVDGNIITSRGMGTAIDFGLKLVEVLFDKVRANEMANEIVYSK